MSYELQNYVGVQSVNFGIFTGSGDSYQSKHLPILDNLHYSRLFHENSGNGSLSFISYIFHLFTSNRYSVHILTNS